MKLLVFGATGRIGKQVVKQAIDQGHSVTAFVRDHSKPDKIADTLSFVEGDVFDPKSVENAVRGQDAVIVALGDGRKGKVRAAGTRNIVNAMEKEGVTRLICQSTLGAGESAGNLNFFWKRIMFGIFLKAAMADHEKQEEIVRNSDLDWTIVRPGAFTGDELTRKYRHGFSPDDRNISLKISLADVADFLLKQLTDSTYMNKAAGLSY